MGRCATVLLLVTDVEWLLHRGNHADAEEVSQDVFFKAWMKISQLCDPQRFSGWLLSIANHMAINRAVRDRKTRETAWSNDVTSVCAEQATPQSTILAQEQQNQVQQGLRRLNKSDQETLTAYYFDDRSLLEISNQLDTPVGTIKRRLHVARRRLAQELATMVLM